jgi:hypothetical protein
MQLNTTFCSVLSTVQSYILLNHSCFSVLHAGKSRILISLKCCSVLQVAHSYILISDLGIPDQAYSFNCLKLLRRTVQLLGLTDVMAYSGKAYSVHCSCLQRLIIFLADTASTYYCLGIQLF